VLGGVIDLCLHLFSFSCFSHNGHSRWERGGHGKKGRQEWGRRGGKSRGAKVGKGKESKEREETTEDAQLNL